jgi:predicted pyridoxine 5'-phosphate oxidase superfamily flavin-nucleotide-binding protein
MSTSKYASDIAFTRAVKAIQTAHGSRANYARMEQRGGWSTELDASIAEFIAAQRSCFLATANAAGQPYIQHRGGPPGFMRVIDPKTIAFADFRGNRQYISVGNLTENPKVHLFLIDYATQSRVKIWGEARVVDDPDFVQSLAPLDYEAVPERAVVIDVRAWDANCSQHIPQRFEAEDVARILSERDAKIAELEERLKKLAL